MPLASRERKLSDPFPGEWRACRLAWPIALRVRVSASLPRRASTARVVLLRDGRTTARVATSSFLKATALFSYFRRLAHQRYDSQLVQRVARIQLSTDQCIPAARGPQNRFDGPRPFWLNQAPSGRWPDTRSGFARYLPIGPLPADGIDLLHQEPKGIKGIARGREDLHSLSRSSISAIEELADCRNPGCLALCLQRQARELGDG
jgi:hypothetical protein